MITMFCAFYEPQIVLAAAVTTFAVTLGCTLIAMCIPGEMTWCYGIAGGILCAMWPLIIFSLFWPDKWLSNLIAFLGAVLSSVYIVIDTKSIMRRLKTSEYVIGALFLYCDIIQLFMYLLSLMGNNS